MKIYKEEDKRYGVEYRNGILVNKERPLNPKTAPWLQSLNSRLEMRRAEQEEQQSQAQQEE